MDACPDFKFISVLATGYNVIDVNYAKEKGSLSAIFLLMERTV